MGWKHRGDFEKGTMGLGKSIFFVGFDYSLKTSRMCLRFRPRGKVGW